MFNHEINIMSLFVFFQVMLGGKNIEEGFGIAYRVIQVKYNTADTQSKCLLVVLTLLPLFLPQDFQLQAQAVYVRAGQRLVRQRQHKAVRQLLKCVGESGTATKNDCDALILSCVSIADKGPADVSDRNETSSVLSEQIMPMTWLHVVCPHCLLSDLG